MACIKDCVSLIVSRLSDDEKLQIVAFIHENLLGLPRVQYFEDFKSEMMKLFERITLKEKNARLRIEDFDEKHNFKELIAEHLKVKEQFTSIYNKVDVDVIEIVSSKVKQVKEKELAQEQNWLNNLEELHVEMQNTLSADINKFN